MSVTSTLPERSQVTDIQALDLAFLGSMLPGIIHNWATPLSGVIGATQLLEKRAATIESLLDGLRDMSDAERDELRKQLDRNKTNVEILSRNAQHLADLLQTLVYRITRGNGVARDLFPLNELVQNEIRFLEANLQFKHKVRKRLTFEPVIPATPYSYGFVAAAIDGMITSSINAHDHALGVLEMEFATVAVNGEGQIRVSAEVLAVQDVGSEYAGLDPYLARLREDGWRAEFGCEKNRPSLLLGRLRRQSAT